MPWGKTGRRVTQTVLGARYTQRWAPSTRDVHLEVPKKRARHFESGSDRDTQEETSDQPGHRPRATTRQTEKDRHTQEHASVHHRGRHTRKPKPNSGFREAHFNANKSGL